MLQQARMRTHTLAAAMLAILSVPALAAEPSPPRPMGSPGDWITDNDYPAAALREDAEGAVRFVLGIAADGSVTDCTVQQSSGDERLDAATCALVRARAKFTPALDAKGRPTTGTYASSVRWQIPHDSSLPPVMAVSYRVVVEKDGSVSSCEVLSDTVQNVAQKACASIQGRTFEVMRNASGAAVRSATTLTEKIERTELPD